MLNVLSTLFPKYYIKIFKNIDLSDKILFSKIAKKGKSNLNFIWIDFTQKQPLFFVKLYFSKILTTNRCKKMLKSIKKLEQANIPFIKPVALFYTSSLKAYLKREPFYGGVIYPFIKSGFLNRNKFFELKKQNFEIFLNNVINFLFNLHEKGIYLKDTKITNFWYENKEIKIFDLDGIKFYSKSLSKYLRLKDLSTFAMSLEWILNNKEEKKQIFNLYQKLYPLTNDDFTLFSALVRERYIKRLKTYNKSSRPF